MTMMKVRAYAAINSSKTSRSNPEWLSIFPHLADSL
jgi:hypothetical protein